MRTEGSKRTDVHTRPAQFSKLLNRVSIWACIFVAFRAEIASLAAHICIPIVAMMDV